jgi:hypothetical protein
MRKTRRGLLSWLRPGFQILAVVALVAGLLGMVSVQGQAASGPIPTFTIITVEKDNLVTIQTADFPANRVFIVRMGKSGTKGIDGIEVGITFSGSGGVFTATYSIPDELKGLSRIAIRLDATSGGYYSYNWFWNNTGGTPPPITPSYSGIPTIKIMAVVKNETVTIKTYNYPANRTFIVRMGVIGTRGIGGFRVGTLESGAGGTFTATYEIPDGLKGQKQIAIRLDSTTGGFNSYNWFWNNTAVDP